MKKFLYVLASISIFIINLSACGNFQDDKSTQDANKDIIEQNSVQKDSTYTQNLSVYEGLWTKNGTPKKEILQNGGAYIELSTENDGSLSGAYNCVQPSTQRIASISFEGLNADNSFSYTYSDDGFGNSGTMSLGFSDDSIEVVIELDELDKDNTSGWQLNSEVLVKPTNANTNDTSNNDSNPIQDETNQQQENNSTNTSLDISLNEYLESIGRLDVPFEEKIFESDTRYYTADEIKSLSKDILSIFRNEIYARHGKVFNDSELNNFFQQFTWYTADEFIDTELNEYEITNLDTVVQVEKELGYR